MTEQTTEKPGWLFYLGWVLLNIIAVVMAWYISWAIMSQITNIVGGRIMIGGRSRITEDTIFIYVLLPAIGLLVGIVQYMLIRRFLPRMKWWVAATFAGWFMPIVFGYLFGAILKVGNDVFSLMVGLLIIGVAFSLPQWWLLNKRLHHAYWWILANGFGFMLIGLLSNFNSEPFPILIGVSLIPTIATGLAWWLLLDWLPEHQLTESLPV